MNVVKLSSNTIKVLKSFSILNQYAFFVKDSNILSILNENYTIKALAVVQENFPETVAFEVVKFLGLATSIFDNAEDSLTISYSDKTISFGNESGQMSATLLAIDKDNIPIFSYLSKEVPFSDDTIYLSFSMTKEMMKNIKQAANILNIQDLVIEYDGSKLSVVVKKYQQIDNPTSDHYSIIPDVQGKFGDKFSTAISIENFAKLVSGNYTVEVHNLSKGAPAKFVLRFLPDEENSPAITYFVSTLFEK